MNFIKQTFFTIVLCFIFQYFLPWWTLVFGAAVAGYYFGNKGWVAFLSGLVAVGILWAVMAMVIDAQTQSILTEKVAKLFPTKTPGLLILLTAFIGGLPAGFAALTGALVKGNPQGTQTKI
jgi:peptidoglycan/LPS O-acetylase OafA/YrhL